MRVIRLLQTQLSCIVLIMAATLALEEQAAFGEPVVVRDLAAETLVIFSNRCAECHDPGGRHIKGGFGYVLDLDQIAANPQIVVPAAPSSSSLYEYVKTGYMPYKRKPLSADQVETVGLWIESLVPAAPTTQPALGGGRSRLIVWLGDFHPATVHFPIGLLVAAAVAELLRSATGTQWLSDAARFCVVTGAIVAVPAAMLGWANAGDWSNDDYVTAIHRWTGTVTAIGAVLTAILCERHHRTSLKRHTHYRVALFFTAALVLAAAFFGGAIVHGLDHYTW